MSPLRRLLALTPPVRGRLALAALASFGALAANIALMTAAPYLLSKAALVSGFAAIAVLVTAVRTFAILRAVLRYVERYLTHLASLRILAHLRVWLFRAIEPLAPAGLLPHRSGDLLARAVADLDSLDDFYVRAIVPPAAALAAAAAACVILEVLNRGLGVALLPFLLLVGIAVPLAARRGSGAAAGRLVDARGELHAELADHFQGLADVLAYGREDEVHRQILRCSSAMGSAQRRLASVRGASAGACAVLSGLAGLVVLALAIPLVRGGAIHGVFLAVVPLVALAAFEGVQSLGDVFRQTEVSRAAAVRTFEVIDAPAAVVDPPEPPPAPGGPSVELRRVRFRYAPGGRPVLDDVSLSAPLDCRLGVVGASGAGKTTIVSLLLRFWEAESGSVMVGGRDVRDCRADDVRAQIGVVPQRIYLFNGTLRDNLLLADGEADDDRILEACGRARLGDFLGSLPDGLDTAVGEDGLKLSGGERQRLALARVFLKAAPILVLDEATANLDALTERDVLREIDRFAVGRSTLVISHRPAALELADHIVTLPTPPRSEPPQ